MTENLLPVRLRTSDGELVRTAEVAVSPLGEYQLPAEWSSLPVGEYELEVGPLVIERFMPLRDECGDESAENRQVRLLTHWPQVACASGLSMGALSHPDRDL